ncbi:dITP/XTP pyrophosphatase [Spiroplasma chinense]|uniref:dITP/XTP pyrophosphatase n=1 Tax=Spiroplasma chinense TaxID=216932 RepID=A0A5B9Y6M9_9MOLU|nr:RdgB/HAM1 family non-canonical purine NTP pyrophosphatase [Spiroplasma chinense]QEH61742.1 dITP/XTP pyrophosphatase [Spiroplasma chinense]
MKKVWIATSNIKKVEELKYALKDFEVKTLLDLEEEMEIEESGKTFEENALIKARYLAQSVEGIVLADDSGICVEGLNGFPGVYSARWAKPLTDWTQIVELLLDKMRENNLSEMKDRKAYFQSSIALIDKEKGFEEVFNGVVQGEVSKEQRGTLGFAYDSVFIPEGYNETFSQIGFEEKQKISHRSRAIEKLKEFLKTHY